MQGIYMSIPPIITGLLIYILFAVIIGLIRFKEKTKKIVFWFISVVYNICFGVFVDGIMFFVFFSSITYFSNIPKYMKHLNLTISTSKIVFQIVFFIVSLLIYGALLIPINIYMKKKSKISTKIYVISNVMATLLGFAIYWVSFFITFTEFLGANR